MKKLNILPLAEKISADDIYKPAPTEKGFKITFPFYVYLSMFAVMIICAFICLPLCMFLFGASFVMAGLDSSGTIRHNRKVVENNAWNRLPFLIIGLLVCSMTVAVTVSSIKNKGSRGSADMSSANIILTLFALAVAAIIIGRLIFLVINVLAVSSRKRHCTCPVHIEGDTLSFYEADPIQNNQTHHGDPVYKYYYEGESYRFADHESLTSFFSEHPVLQVYIDPDEPERYYSPYLFKQSGVKLKSYLKNWLFILLLTSPLWGTFLFKYLVDKNII